MEGDDERERGEAKGREGKVLTTAICTTESCLRGLGTDKMAAG